MIKKLLVKRQKKAFIQEQNREVVISDEKIYFVEDIDKDYHCSDGVFDKDDLKKSDVIIKSNNGKEFYIINASFIDSFKGIRKTAQTIPLKDLGFILAEIGLSKTDIVVDAGSGSGACACFLARYAKKVYSYDIEEKNLKQSKENAVYFHIKNVTFEKLDIYSQKPHKCDIVILDLPEPWRAISQLRKALKSGGFLIAYCPQIIQTQQLVNEALKNNYLHLKTVEIVERDWKVEGQIVRPKSLSNIHSGFITIMRKII